MNPAPVLDGVALVAAMSAGLHPGWLLFWGHRPSADGRTMASCLSQWWPAPFVLDDERTYPTAEHAMMAGNPVVSPIEPGCVEIRSRCGQSGIWGGVCDESWWNMEGEPAWKDVKRLRPVAASPGAHRKMTAVGRRDTPQEMAVRKALFRAGCRYRIHFRPLTDRRWTADIAFTGAKVLVFVDGCFWHGCPIHGTIPKSNREWWTAKIQRNVERDREADRVLTERGWTVLRAWSHEKPDDVVVRVLGALRTTTAA